MRAFPEGHRIRHILLVSLVLVAVGLTGCLDIREDVHVHADGTARYDLDLAMPEMFFGFMAAAGGDSSASSPGLNLWGAPIAGKAADSTRTRDFVEGDMHHFAMERDLRSLAQLPAIAVGDSSKGEMRGRALPGYSLTRLDASRVRLVRAMDPDSADRAKMLGRLDAEGQGAGAMSDAAGKRMFAGRTYTLRIHAPHIESSNGTIAADGKSVEWTMPIVALFGDDRDSLRKLEAVIVTRPRR